MAALMVRKTVDLLAVEKVEKTVEQLAGR